MSVYARVCMSGVQRLAHKSLLFIWRLACPRSQPRGVCNGLVFRVCAGTLGRHKGRAASRPKQALGCG